MGHAGRQNIYEGAIRKMVTQALEAQEEEFRKEHASDTDIQLQEYLRFCAAKLLLLDEPTKGIDSFFKETFAEILKSLQSQGITIVMVSHDVEFCARYADLVSMFFDGQILTTDHPRRFFGNNSFYTTAANRMSRHVFNLAVTVEDVIDLYRQNKEGRL